MRILKNVMCPNRQQIGLATDIYLPDADTRTTLPIKHPTCRWGCRSRGED